MLQYYKTLCAAHTGFSGQILPIVILFLHFQSHYQCDNIVITYSTKELIIFMQHVSIS